MAPFGAQVARATGAHLSAGKILVSSGRLEAINDQNEIRLLKRGDPFWEGDRLRLASGQAQVQLTDGTLFSLAPNTEFRIDAYAFNQQGKEDTNQVTLLKGILRTLTGQVAQQKAEGYRVKAQVTTIGVRASVEKCDDKLPKKIFLCEIGNPTMFAMSLNASKELTVSVTQGTVTLPSEEEPEKEIPLKSKEAIKVEPGKPPERISFDELLLGTFPSFSIPGMLLSPSGAQNLPQGATLTRSTRIGVQSVKDFADSLMIPIPALSSGVFD